MEHSYLFIKHEEDADPSASGINLLKKSCKCCGDVTQTEYKRRMYYLQEANKLF